MSSGLAIVAVALFSSSCGIEKETEPPPPLNALAVSPDSVTLPFGSRQEFQAVGTFATNGDRRPVRVHWCLVGDPVGSLDVPDGETVHLTAQAPGYALLLGVSADLADTARILVTPPDPYPVFDGSVHDFLGVFNGFGDTALVALVVDPEHSDSGLVMQLDFRVTRLGYAGLFIERGSLSGHEVVDMREFANGHLRLRLRSSHDVQIGIRSDNIIPGDERSKLWLRESGLARCDGTWETVAVPLALLGQLESALDFTRMEVFLVAAVDGLHTFGPTSGALWVGSAQWTKD